MTSHSIIPTASRKHNLAHWTQMGALACFALYVVFAPHSIAGAWIALSFAVLCWLVRLVVISRTGLVRTAFDVPAWTLFAVSIVSAVFSYEPHESLAKLGAVTLFLCFYLTHSLLTRRAIRWLTVLLLASGVAGVLWSATDLVRGRGVVIAEISQTSPLRSTILQAGDCVWRVGKRRVWSVEEIDEALRDTTAGKETSISVVSRGEHVEWRVRALSESERAAASVSGIIGAGRTHRFRASGWTKHYETFAEVLQLLAQLALGLTLAHLFRSKRTTRADAALRSEMPEQLNRSGISRYRVQLLAVTTLLLAAGIAITAMRTTLVAFACGALVVLLRALRPLHGKQFAKHLTVATRIALLVFVPLVLFIGALIVWQTRDAGALQLRDHSSSLRFAVARRAIERIPLHPVFGHGMDTLKHRWTEWGFPGDVPLHAHSTVVQIAFERGLPALICWLWLMYACWKLASTNEKDSRSSDDTDRYGFALGACGALAGFLASSLVNYNFGDSEVTLLLFWIVGALVRDGTER